MRGRPPKRPGLSQLLLVVPCPVFAPGPLGEGHGGAPKGRQAPDPRGHHQRHGRGHALLVHAPAEEAGTRRRRAWARVVWVGVTWAAAMDGLSAARRHAKSRLGLHGPFPCAPAAPAQQSPANPRSPAHAVLAPPSPSVRALASPSRVAWSQSRPGRSWLVLGWRWSRKAPMKMGRWSREARSRSRALAVVGEDVNLAAHSVMPAVTKAVRFVRVYVGG